jgi:hypothetical protein
MSRFLSRRPLAFSLRTLMVLVRVCAAATGWLAHQRHLVQARMRLSERLRAESKADFVPAQSYDVASVPTIRECFGDMPMAAIVRYRAMTMADRVKVARLFPEANVLWSGSMPADLLRARKRDAVRPAALRPEPVQNPGP